MGLDALILRSFRLTPPATDAPAIWQRSVARRAAYEALDRQGRWTELAAAALNDLRGSQADVPSLLSELLVIRAAATQLRRSRARFRSIVETYATLEDDTGAQFPGIDMRAAQSVVDEPETSRFHGRIARRAARSSARLQAHALQRFTTATFARVAAAARESGDAERALAAFTSAPSLASVRARTVRRWQALRRLQRRIYASIISDRTSVRARLDELRAWVLRNIADLATLHAVIALLAERANPGADPYASSSVASLAVSAAMLVREASASYIACVVATFSLNGTRLNTTAADVLASAGRIPFEGMLNVGKRTSVRRLGRLPDAMPVRLAGVMTHVAAANAVDFVGRLIDVEGGGVSVVAPFNLSAAGLGAGSYVLLTGYFRKAGSALLDEPHVEIEKLKLRELYARDIWQTAFLNIAAPYYRLWPGDYHIAFSPPPGTFASTVGSSLNIDVCAEEQLQLSIAQTVYDAALAAYLSAASNANLAGVAATQACMPGPSPACTAALDAWKAALALVNTREAALYSAESTLSAAQAAYDECIAKWQSTGTDDGGDSNDDDDDDPELEDDDDGSDSEDAKQEDPKSGTGSEGGSSDTGGTSEGDGPDDRGSDD